MSVASKKFYMHTFQIFFANKLLRNRQQSTEMAVKILRANFSMTKLMAVMMVRT